MALSEDRILSDFHIWLWNNRPDLRRTCFHPLNEGSGDPVIGAINKAKGVVAGVSDYICLVRGGRGEPGLILEFKTDTGVLSPKQILFRDAVVAQGFVWELVRSFDRAQEVFLGYISGEGWSA